MQNVAGPKVENQKKSVDRIEGQPEHVRAGTLDSDLPHQVTIRLNDIEHGIAGERSLGIEAEGRHVDVVVGTDCQSFDATRNSWSYIRQHCQDIDVTAIPSAHWR